jgi:hypothetical protein
MACELSSNPTAMVSLTSSSYRYGYIGSAPPSYGRSASTLSAHRTPMNTYNLQNFNDERAWAAADGYMPQQITHPNTACNDHVPKPTSGVVQEATRKGNEEQVRPVKSATTVTQTEHAPPGARYIPAAIPTARWKATAEKMVHWGTGPKVGRAPRPAIRRTQRQRELFTVRFTVNFVICAQSYTVHVLPLEFNQAGVDPFEAQLIREVAKDHEETLRAFLTFNEYSLTFQRPSRTSSTVIPTGEHVVRDAAFKTFLNAVFRDANVSLE